MTDPYKCLKIEETAIAGFLTSRLLYDEGRFTIVITRPGDRQFEEDKLWADELGAFLEEEGKYRLIANTSEQTGDNDLFFYQEWGGYVYIHLALFSRETVYSLAASLAEHSNQFPGIHISDTEIIFHLPARQGENG